ncbi:MAG: c-type cytochrome [Acidobacteria bacterium]|nr:c-type cytochrome [Acidobacteriota bacterium]
MLPKSSHHPHPHFVHPAWKHLFFIAMLLLLYLFLLARGLSAQQGMPWHWMHMNRALVSWTSVTVSSPPPADSGTLASGKKVYLSNCTACHGENGKGDGRWANYLTPRPRNFTRGIFRFKSTPSGTLPTDKDLFRTVSAGVNGTAMPSWQFVLPEKERWAVVAYLKTLCKDFAEEAAGQPIILAPTPDIRSERVVRGGQVFQKNCVECHGPQGYGDGPSARNMEDSFGDPIEPRNFHRVAEFKRGHTLDDIALAVATGNDGTPMPSFSPLGREDIWNVASYVMSLAETTDGGSQPSGCCPMRMGMQ